MIMDQRLGAKKPWVARLFQCFKIGRHYLVKKRAKYWGLILSVQRFWCNLARVKVTSMKKMTAALSGLLGWKDLQVVLTKKPVDANGKDLAPAGLDIKVVRYFPLARLLKARCKAFALRDITEYMSSWQLKFQLYLSPTFAAQMIKRCVHAGAPIMDTLGGRPG